MRGGRWVVGWGVGGGGWIWIVEHSDAVVWLIVGV